MTSRHCGVSSVIALSSVLSSSQEGFMHSETITKDLSFRPSMRTMTCYPGAHTSEKVMGLGPSRTTITTLHFPLMHVLRYVCLCTFGLLSVCVSACSYPDESASWSCVRTPASLTGVEEESRRSAAMVETPAGCPFEEIQYEDIQVEAVTFNLPTTTQRRH